MSSQVRSGQTCSCGMVGSTCSTRSCVAAMSNLPSTMWVLYAQGPQTAMHLSSAQVRLFCAGDRMLAVLASHWPRFDAHVFVLQLCQMTLSSMNLLQEGEGEGVDLNNMKNPAAGCVRQRSRGSPSDSFAELHKPPCHHTSCICIDGQLMA